MKIKILAVTHNGNDAHSFWRFLGPLLYLQKVYEEVEIIVKTLGTDDVLWPSMLGCNLVMLHRPCTKDDISVIQLAKLCGVPVWMDLDDWLFDVPIWNPTQNFYGNPGTKLYLAHAIATCDVVSVTTAELFNRVRKVNPNVVIVPNAYRNDLFGYRSEVVPPRENIAVWRGTSTHDGDLQSVADGFKNLKGKVHFLGSPSWAVLAGMPKDSYATLTAQDFLVYFMHIYKMRPKVFVFPLADCLFNHCKSNISWMEALHAGALCVAPDFPEWNRPGCVTYKAGDSKSFEDAVNSVFEMDEQTHQEHVSLAYASMTALYGINQINTIREVLINRIINPKFQKNIKDPYDQLLAVWALSQLVEVPRIQEEVKA